MPYFIPAMTVLFAVCVLIHLMSQKDVWYYLANIATITFMYVGVALLAGRLFGEDYTSLFTTEPPWRWFWGAMFIHAILCANRFPIWIRRKKPLE